MCGIYGAISIKGTLSKKEYDVIKLLGLVSWLRGKDSSGMFAVSATGSTAYHKSILPVYEFLELPKTERLMPYSQCKAVVGHTRAATIGSVTAANAHPFDFPNIIGVHNGTIDRMCISDYLDVSKDYGTDSEALYSKINDSSFEEVIPKVEGAWALVAFDKVNNTINVLRNQQRTLYFAYSEDRSCFYFASEAEFLIFALSRTNTKIEIRKEGDSGVYLLMPDILHKFPINTNDELTTVPLESTIKYTRYVTNYSTPVNNTNTHNQLYGNTNKHNTSNRNTNNVSSVSDHTTINFKPTIDVTTNYKCLKVDNTSVRISRDVFNSIKTKSCELCDSELVFDDGVMVLAYEPTTATADSTIVGVCQSCIDKDRNAIKLLRSVVATSKAA